MAAISARLASMGFMKRGEAAKAGKQQPQQQQPAQQQSLRQQQQQHASRQPGLKQEPGVEEQAAAAPPHTGDGSSQQQQQQQQQDGKSLQLSESISSMKFMQRAQLKRSRDDAFDQEQAAKDAAEWVAATAVQDRGCLILHERDPLPAGASGRMSFGFGHLHDLAAAEAAEEQAAAEAEAAGREAAGEGEGRFGMHGSSGKRPKDFGRRDAKRQRR